MIIIRWVERQETSQTRSRLLKNNKKKQVNDEDIALNEMVVKRKITLKDQKQMKKWEEVKHKNNLLELKKTNSINGLFHS